MKVIKKIAIIAMAAIMSLSTMVIATGCGNGGKEIEIDGWLLYKFSIISERSGQVNILAVKDESLVVDGVLNIPAKIGKYKITGFGIPSAVLSATVQEFGLPEGFNIERVVVAAELEINVFTTFKGVKYIEFLSTTFENIHSLTRFADMVLYIIPDGSTENFLARLEKISTLSEEYNFIEKSEFLKEKIGGK